MELCVFVGMVAVPAGLVILAFGWIVGPLLLAARTARSPSRFLLSDLIWLLVQMQIAMVVTISAFPATLPANVRIVALVLVCLPVGIFWLASLHLVSQAGIQKPLRRAAVFVVLLPGATIAFIGMPLAAIGLLQAVAEPHHFGNRLATISWQMAALACLTLALGWLARWAVARPSLP